MHLNILRSRHVRLLTAPLALSASFTAAHATATTTVTVDLSATIGPAKHIASGSLYGVTETKPADVEGLIAPLHPNVFNNPATAGSGKQQPVGSAIVVAGRLASLGARVTFRLADWLPGWPYQFTTMADWLGKVDMTVSQRKAAGLTNVYAYEIWNEPNGTWGGSDPNSAGTRPLSFNQMWLQTFQHLRQVDTGFKITGPSVSYYQSSYFKAFLTFCKANNCLPDIIGWHELSGGNLTSNYQNYRAMEKELGIGPLPISINEYSGKNDLTDEGKPGASAPMIAKFERLQYDSACISYWDVAHAGRLGSLLATDTAKNGGWWFYKWYGDMSGNMVTTTPPSPNDATALDAFANLDTTGAKASVLVGGVNDGTIQIVVKGFQAAAFFGSKVHAVVEHTPFVNRTTVVNAADIVSTADIAVSNNQISVTIPAANGSDGYRLSLTPSGGGTGGTGGAAGAGGAAATGGASGTGGSATTGGAPGTGGTGETGGVASIAGATNATGGELSTAGSSFSGAGGSAPAGTGGGTATGGAFAAAGQSAAAGTTPASGGGAGTAGDDNSSDPSSCALRAVGGGSSSSSIAILSMMGLLLMLKRRRASSR